MEYKENNGVVEEVKIEEKDCINLNKKSHLKALVVILICLLVVSVVFNVILLNRQVKCKDNNSTNTNSNDYYNPKEDIKGFGSRFDEFTVEKGEARRVKVNGFFITIENKQDGVYLNNKKTNIFYTTGGFVLDKFLVLYSSAGNANLVFYDAGCNEISFENSSWYYENLKLENDVISADAYPNRMGDKCNIIENVNICPCKDGETPNMLEHKEEILKFKDKTVKAEVDLVYDGNKVVTREKNKETVESYYKAELQGETKKYCVETIDKK